LITETLHGVTPRVVNVLFFCNFAAGSCSHFGIWLAEEFESTIVDTPRGAVGFYAGYKFGHPPGANWRPHICVFIKFIQPDQAEFCRKATKVLNIVDNFDVSASKGLNVDAYISTSPNIQSTMRELRPDIPTWYIPAHHTNFDNVRVDTSRPVKRIGMHFAYENTPDPAVQDALREYARLHDLEFVLDLYTQPALEVSKDVADGAALAHEHNAETYRRLSRAMDVLIIFPTAQGKRGPMVVPRESAVKYKPVTRAAMAWSMGMPVVLFPFESYVYALEEANVEYPAFASTAEEVVEWVDRIVTSQETRIHLSEQGLRLGQYYATKPIARQYATKMTALLLASENKKVKGRTSLPPEPAMRSLPKFYVALAVVDKGLKFVATSGRLVLEPSDFIVFYANGRAVGVLNGTECHETNFYAFPAVVEVSTMNWFMLVHFDEANDVVDYVSLSVKDPPESWRTMQPHSQDPHCWSLIEKAEDNASDVILRNYGLLKSQWYH